MAEQNPNTGLIEMPDLSTSSVCRDLFNSFFASIKTSQDGRVDIPLDNRIKNAAYSLASPIANSIVTSEPTEPQINTFVKKAGDNMSGRLGTLFGFQAGENGQIFIQTVKVEQDGKITDKYISIEEKLKVNSNNLFIDNKIIFNHYTDTFLKKEILEVNAGDITDFLHSDIKTTGNLTIGTNKTNGFYASSTELTYTGHIIYHAGNSNKSDVNWTTNNLDVHGNLSVTGSSTLKGELNALYGVKLGYNGNPIATISGNQIQMDGDICLRKNNKIKVNNVDTLYCPADFHIQLSAIGGDLILGGSMTNNIRLWNTLTTETGDHDLIDKFGKAYFMNSLQAGYGFGDTLLSTYTDSVIIHKKLSFQDKSGPYLSADTCGISLAATFKRSDSSSIAHQTNVNYEKSTSVYSDQSRDSESVVIDSSADFFLFKKPIEGADFIGIQETTTRLAKNMLFFNDNNYLLYNNVDGIKHFGNSYFMGNLSSERFSTGFAGEGWAIRKKIDTGNIEITADEAVFRKKIRAYEFEIQKISAVNGSLWVSGSCAGDTVESIK